MKKARMIVADSETCADLLYACGFSAPDSFVYYAHNGQEYIVVSRLELNRAENECHDHIIVKDCDDYFDKSKTSHGLKDLVKAITQLCKVDSWEVPQDFPLVYADVLRADGIAVECADDLFFPQREEKLESEIDLVKQAMIKTERGMQRAAGVLAQSIINDDSTVTWNGQQLTSELLRAEIEVELIRNGAAPFHTIVACGVQGSEPHNAGTGPIYAHQPIVIDIFPRVVGSGYWGDMTRTFVKGKATDVVKRAYEAVKSARDRAKIAIKSGVTGEAAHAIAFETLKEHGFETGCTDGVYHGFTHGLGHGVGLEIHEAPRVSPANKNPLKTGNIITVEPGLYYPEWGGIRLEDIGVVRDDRFECFNSFPTTLEIK